MALYGFIEKYGIEKMLSVSVSHSVMMLYASVMTLKYLQPTWHVATYTRTGSSGKPRERGKAGEAVYPGPEDTYHSIGLMHNILNMARPKFFRFAHAGPQVVTSWQP